MTGHRGSLCKEGHLPMQKEQLLGCKIKEVLKADGIERAQRAREMAVTHTEMRNPKEV